MFSLHGIGLGGGIAIARARRLDKKVRDIARYHIPAARAEAEFLRLEDAIRRVGDELSTLRERLPADAPEEAGALLDVYTMILADPLLVQGTRDLIEIELRNAEWALAGQTEKLARQFEEFDDVYLRERSRDVRQVADRVLEALAGSGRAVDSVGSERLVFVADDIAPADMLQLKHGIGFAIDQGGTTSHTAILARSMDVPAVVGMQCAHDMLRDDDWVILDGDAGLMICAPDESVLAEYRERQAARELERSRLRRLATVPSRTLDGAAVQLLANIELPEEAELALENGAQGVGLYRTEFLFMNRADSPGEDEQYEAYSQAVQAMSGRPVTIRTLDAGADKALQLQAQPAAATNPALGLRAIRYCLSRPDLFLVQLRAILRASVHGPVRILLPMITHEREILESLRLIAQAREQLAARGVAVAAQVPVGAMIEVPAAALSAAHFLSRLDFLSIGTNDLIQYTLAIDRADYEVASLYDPFHPAVLKLIAATLEVGRQAGKPVAVCGELAGDPGATRLLLGLGLTEFSMHPVNLLRVKREVLLSEVHKLVPAVGRLLLEEDPARVHEALSRLRRSEAA